MIFPTVLSAQSDLKVHNFLNSLIYGTFLSSLIARWSRNLTVPSGIESVSMISFSDISSTKRNNRTSRCLLDSTDERYFRSSSSRPTETGPGNRSGSNFSDSLNRRRRRSSVRVKFVQPEKAGFEVAQSTPDRYRSVETSSANKERFPVKHRQ